MFTENEPQEADQVHNFNHASANRLESVELLKSRDVRGRDFFFWSNGYDSITNRLIGQEREIRRFRERFLSLPQALITLDSMVRRLDVMVMIGCPAWKDVGSKPVEGLLNQTGTTPYLIPADGIGSSALWSAKGPWQILRDMLGCVNAIPRATNEEEYPTHLVVPIDHYRTYLQGMKLQAGSSETVLEAFERATSGLVKVVTTRYMADVPDENHVSNRLVAFDNSPIKVQRLVGLAPQIENQHVLTLEEVTELNKVQEALGRETHVVGQLVCDVHARSGGVRLHCPKSMCIAEGI